MNLSSSGQGQRAARCALAAMLCGAALLSHAQDKPAEHVVIMEAVRFSPDSLEVRPGDTIVWKNRDAFPHNATAESGAFQSGEIQAGASWTWKAGARGVFPYTCTLHPGMRAVITVK